MRTTLFSLFLALGGLFPSMSSAADPLSRFSLPTLKMEEFAKKCVHVPTERQMEQDLQKWISEGKHSGQPLLSVLLDGFPFREISENEFRSIRNLTIYRGAHGPFKDQFSFQMKVADNRAEINRACVDEKCGAKGKEARKFDLSPYQKEGAPLCSDALCGARRIFGDVKGVFILWAYYKFGTNLSPFSDSMADPSGLDAETLKAVIAASLLVPDHLKNVALKDTGFFRYLKGTSLPFYKGQKVVANSFGGVFDPIEGLNFSEKIYFFVHELAHRARLRATPSLDESPDWMKAAGWKNASTPPDAATHISAYAKVNPFEDFAETYSLYRLDPTRLKSASPERYSFMKEKVFDGVEYTMDPCAGSKSVQSAQR